MILGKVVASSKSNPPEVILTASLGGTQTTVCETVILGKKQHEQPFPDRTPSNSALAMYFEKRWPHILAALKAAGISRERVAQIRNEVLWDMTPSSSRGREWIKTLARGNQVPDTLSS